MPVALALAAGIATARAAPATGAGAVPVATMSVEVVSIRAGTEAARIVARTRPGEPVVLRDERRFPYDTATGGVPGKASVPVGLVTVVVPEIRAGNLSVSFRTTVRHVTGMNASPAGPVVSQAEYGADLVPAFSEGAFTARQEVAGTGFAVRVTVRPLASARNR